MSICESSASSAPFASPAAPAPFPAALSLAELADAVTTEVEWLWDGYLARGNLTLLTSQWKTGKTTLLGVLLSKLHHGGKLAGRRVQPARACIISEESPKMWRRRGEKLKLDLRTMLLCRPFPSKPTLAVWHQLLAHLADERARGAFDLLVVDTLAAMLPAGAENHADTLLAALRPLERLTAAGAAVLLLHHPRKGPTMAGQAARGTGALAALSDVILEMQMLPKAAADDRRRKLVAFSRHDETPRELVIALAADGRSYDATEDDTIDVEIDRAIAICREILESSGEMLKRERILDEWPQRPKPNPGTLLRWLNQGVAKKVLRREGNGRRGNPFRYGVAGDDAPWHPTDDDVLAKLGGNYLDALFK